MKISNEFSGLSYCLIIKVHSFSLSFLNRNSLTSLPHSFVFVKHFFELFWKSCFSKLSKLSLRFDSFHSITPMCYSVNTFFQLFSFLKFCLKKERRKRDLNPRAAINDLLPFQGSPFSRLGISPVADIMSLFNSMFRKKSSNHLPSGECGIRTHGPFRNHWFSRPAP